MEGAVAFKKQAYVSLVCSAFYFEVRKSFNYVVS